MSCTQSLSPIMPLSYGVEGGEADIETQLKESVYNRYQHLNAILPIHVAKLPDAELFCPKQPLWYIDRSHLKGDGFYSPFPIENLLKCYSQHKPSQRTILTVGPCGIGKTTAVAQVALDWAKNRAYTHIDLLFVIPCVEIHLMRGLQLSLIRLLHFLSPGMHELTHQSLKGKKIWLVFDELQDMVGPLTSLWDCPIITNVNKVASVPSLIVNLIKGHLLPNTHIWVTSQYAAMDLIPAAHILRKTELLGFNNGQKKQFITKLVGNEALGSRIMEHIGISKSLNGLCRVPYMCTVMATVLRKHVKLNDFKVSNLTLTEIMTCLVLALQPKQIEKLVIFAHQYLNTHPYCTWTFEKDLTDGGLEINVDEASYFAKKHPLLFKEEKSMFGVSMFCFTHFCVLEYFTAIATHSKELTEHDPKQFSTAFLQMIEQTESVCEDRMLEFVFHFFFGLLKKRRTLQLSDPFFVNIKKQILCGFDYNYKTVNRYRWLREFDNRALADEVDAVMDPIRHRPLLALTCEELSGVCKMSETLEGIRFDFPKGLIRNDEAVPKCVVFLLKCGRVVLRFSNLSSACCPVMSFILSCKESHVRELDLGFNSLTDQGMNILARGLSDQNCRLKILRLPACELTSSACEYLAAALKQCITLKELDLSCNSIGDVGMQHLATGLESPKCLLETLKLSQCNIKRQGIFHLASALQKNPGVFKWLDLSMNMIGSKAANELCSKFNISKLNTLYLYCCCLSDQSCGPISLALQKVNSNLISLNLSSNYLTDKGVELICAGLYAGSRLQKLNLSRCGVTKDGCHYITNVLTHLRTIFTDKEVIYEVSGLKEINLSRNRLEDDGGVFLSVGLENPLSAVEKLDLTECFLSSGCCLQLALRLSVPECRVQELDLTDNCIKTQGIKRLCVALKKPQCALRKLVLRNCGLNSKCVPLFSTALKTNVNLKELYLAGNRLDDSAKKVLVGMAESNTYKLETIDV